MGAASSIIINDVEDDKYPLYNDTKALSSECNTLKNLIADDDVSVIEKEEAKAFKNHGEIIELITSRTKNQLKRVITSSPNIISKLNGSGAKPYAPENLYKLIGFENYYLKFLSSLFFDKETVEVSSMNTTKYDEESIVNIIGTSSIDEIKAFAAKFEEIMKVNLTDYIREKAKDDSPVKYLLLKILTYERIEKTNITDPDIPIDKDLAKLQAVEIQTLATALTTAVSAAAADGLSKNSDLKRIIDIISKSSREQCAAIGRQYSLLFSMKLERAINMAFRGHCAKLLILWIQPIPESICMLINFYTTEKILANKAVITSTIAKYDKNTLAIASTACERLYDCSLLQLMGGLFGLSGNLLKAVKGWIENTTPDDGYEYKVDSYLLPFKSLDNNNDMDVLHENGLSLGELNNLIQNQKFELEKYIEYNSITAKAKAKVESIKKDTIIVEAKIGISEKKSSFKFESSSKRGENDVEYKKKFDLIMKYLTMHFELYDKKKSGAFESDTFWEILGKLPLNDLGYTDEEISIMRDCSDWEFDGLVYYKQTLAELTDSIINSMESSKNSDEKSDDDDNFLFEMITKLIEKKNDELIESSKMSSPKNLFTKTTTQSTDLNLQSNKYEVQNFESDLMEDISSFLPSELIQYLYTTGTSFDMDSRGYLIQDELESFINLINVEVSMDSFSITTKDAKIKITNIVDILCMRLLDWIQDGRDHFICLVDKETGSYFWYNTKDQSSQPASTEEGELYPSKINNQVVRIK